MDKITILAKKIEIDFLKAISELLSNGEITLQTAKQSGKDFLALLPFSSEEDMQSKIKTFVEDYPKLEKVNAILLTYIDEGKTNELLEKIRVYIHKTE